MRTPFNDLERTLTQGIELFDPNKIDTSVEVDGIERMEVNDNKGTDEPRILDDGGYEVSDDGALLPNKIFTLNGIEYKTDDNGIIYCIDGETLPQYEFTKNGHVYETDSDGKIKSIDGKPVDECQEVADKTAQDYNEKYKPYDRAVNKGIDGVRQTENGGVSFADSDSIYTTEDGKKAVVKIKATGNRNRDFSKANEELGIDEVPDGYVWHHVDDYNVEDNTITMELVKDEAHNATKPHSGGCAQYDAVNGSSYNPPKKEQNNG